MAAPLAVPAAIIKHFGVKMAVDIGTYKEH
jgi:hypothetical protein